MTDEELRQLPALEYYKWHWQRFRANRRVQRMDYIARGLYRELLDEQWIDGSISADLAELADICACPVEVMQEKWPQIAGCFLEDEHGRLFNQTLEDQRTALDATRIKRAKNGRSGGLQKLANAKQVLASAKQVPSKCHIEEKRREEKSREKAVGVAPNGALPGSNAKVAGTLPLNDKTEYEIFKHDVDTWRELYPAIDVVQQLRNMKGWLLSNPKNMKTRSGISRFINTWLKDEQNKAPRAKAPATGGNRNAGDTRSRAQTRQDNSFAAIDAAFERFIDPASKEAHGADEGELSESGANAGNERDMGSAVVIDGGAVRIDGVSGSADISARF